MLEELQKSKRDFKIEKCVIFGMHKLRGFQKGKLIFPNERSAQNHLNMIKSTDKRYNNYTFFIIMPVK